MINRKSRVLSCRAVIPLQSSSVPPKPITQNSNDVAPKLITDDDEKGQKAQRAGNQFNQFGK